VVGAAVAAVAAAAIAAAAAADVYNGHTAVFLQHLRPCLQTLFQNRAQSPFQTRALPHPASILLLLLRHVLLPWQHSHDLNPALCLPAPFEPYCTLAGAEAAWQLPHLQHCSNHASRLAPLSPPSTQHTMWLQDVQADLGKQATCAAAQTAACVHDSHDM